MSTLATTPQLISELRADAAKCRQIPDEQLTPPPSPQTIRLAGAELQPAIEAIKVAAGGEAIKRLKDSNAAAEAVNRIPRRSRDALSRLAALNQQEEESPRYVDIRRLSHLHKDLEHDC